jgi:hypothetical protein
MDRLAILLSREAEVNQFNVAVLVEQVVLQFQVAVDAGLVMDVYDGADEDALDHGRFEGAVIRGERGIFRETVQK